MDNPTISIIIPAFNAERFLNSLIESVLVQSFTEIEVIVINDGSTDKTESIITHYVEKDDRIKMITKRNEGVSIARNTALKHAKGKYIYFADADDLLIPNGLQILFETAIHNAADFVRADHHTIGTKCEELFENKLLHIRKKFGNKLIDSRGMYNKILLGEFFLWVCLFRRDIIVNNNIEFIPHCRFMEDAAFIVEYLTHCNRCFYVPEYVYKYRIYGDTAGQVKKDYSKDLKQIMTKISSFEQTDYIENLKKKIEYKTINSLSQKIIQQYNKIVINIKYFLCK